MATAADVIDKKASHTAAGMPLRLDRLRRLQARRKELESLNKRELLKETRRQKHASLEAKNANRIAVSPQTPSTSNDKLVKYSVSEFEDWEMKKHSKADNKNTQSYDGVAQMSYAKEIASLPVDKEAYERETQASSRASPSEIRTSEVDKEALATLIKRSTERKLKKQGRKAVGEAGSFINEKNKQFNMKLSREYG